ncbi:MAG: methyltransferase domain-containing protein [Candidatus Moduliflexus flocculans]|nr:methyltransferase domain-containing protein [Candidatus Moduliflexus flocculans]
MHGIELNPASVKSATQNAWLNGVKNVEFHQGDASHFIAAVAKEGITPDIVVVDPPRQGLDPVFVNAMIGVKPPKIVYISCDPSTLARDVKLFVANGYALRRVQPVDMFCQTAHVEDSLVAYFESDDERINNSHSDQFDQNRPSDMYLR